MAMTTYFFDTNFLFRVFFNKNYLYVSDLRDYLNNDSAKFISGNVEYEFSNIFLVFLNQLNHFLIAPYYELEGSGGDMTLEDYMRLTESIEVLKFNNKGISEMIWKCVCGDKKSISKKDFRKGLKRFIFDFNHYFHFKYNDLMGQITIHRRLEDYHDISMVLGHVLHRSDLKICLDAHDVAVKNGIDDLVFVTGDRSFLENAELILEYTEIDTIMQFKHSKKSK